MKGTFKKVIIVFLYLMLDKIVPNLTVSTSITGTTTVVSNLTHVTLCVHSGESEITVFHR